MALSASLAARSVEFITHFTSTYNLLGIIEAGALLSRSRMDEIGGDAERRACYDGMDTFDEQRFDELRRYVNTNITRPNSYLLNQYRNRFRDKAYLQWCVLLIDAEVLAQRDVLFSVTNAASKVAKDYGINGGAQGFDALFNEVIITTRGRFTRRGLAANIPTDIQAEALVPDMIDLKYVRHVVFETQSDLSEGRRALTACVESSIIDRFCVDDRLFKP